LTANQQQAQLWDPATGKPLGDPLFFQGYANQVAMHGGGKIVATAGYYSARNRYEVRIRNVATRTVAGSFPLGTSGANALVFSPDGKTLLARFYQEVRLWNVATGKTIGQPIRHPTYYLENTVFSPDSKRVLTTGNQQFQFWDAATGKPVGEPLRNMNYSAVP